MSKIQEEAEGSRVMLENKEIASENTVYVAQLQELARVFSSSGDRHIRQLVINVAKGVIERSDDYKKVEGYVDEMLG